MNIVTVIPLEKGVYPSNLTYFTAKEVSSGDIVSVPIRSKKVLALALSSQSADAIKSDVKDLTFNLKKISGIKEKKIFRSEFLESVLEINTYYAGRKDYGVASLIPHVFIEEYDKIAKSFTRNTAPVITGAVLRPGSSNNVRSEKLVFQAPLEDRISYYKTMIRESFALKKSVFMVLPTEHDISTFHESLSKGIENFAFTFHGSMPAKKSLQEIEKALTAAHPVLIFATAPYLALRRDDFGTIIVEHENSNTYKMIRRPHADLRAFAELFASKIKAKFILSDTMLRFETIARQDIDGLHPIGNLSFRSGSENKFDGQIEIQKRHNPVDETFLKEKNPKKHDFKVLTDEVIADIRQTVARNKSVFIFALRKGLATQTVCRDCNEILMCENCMAPVVLYLSRNGKQRIFACNRCHTEVDPDTTCKRCGSWNLIPLGIGTDTVYEELEKIFRAEDAVKIFKLDKESAQTAKAAEKIIKDFESAPGSILVGTEMAFFYMREKAALSVIASFDSLWSIPNFKMSEKVVQIVTSILAKTEYRVLIQTKNENDPALVAVMTENLLSFVREELEDRRKLGYPPYKRFIKIVHLGTRSEALDAKKALLEVFKEFNPEIFSGFVAKLNDKYVTNALIKVDPKEWALPEISAAGRLNPSLLSKLSMLPPAFDVFIDPEDLL